MLPSISLNLFLNSLNLMKPTNIQTILLIASDIKRYNNQSITMRIVKVRQND